MQTIKAQDGERLGVTPTDLMVPVQLEYLAQSLIQTQYLAPQTLGSAYGTITTVGDFYSFSATPNRPPDMAQWVGEHNREILLDLGYTEAEIDRLSETGAIASPEFRLARL